MWPLLRFPAALTSLSVALLLAAASDASAQAPASITPPASKQRFSTDVRSTVGYASNVAGGGDILATIRGIEPNDVTYGLGATLKFQPLTGRTAAFLTAAADARRHQRNKTLDGEDYQVSAGVSSQVGPCIGLLAASYARRQSLVEDLALPIVTNVTEQPLGTASVSCGRGGIIGSVQGSIGKLKNDLKRPGFVDSDTKGGSVSIGYRNKIFGDISLIGQYSKVGYSNAIAVSQLPVSPRNPDFEQYAVGVQYARRIGMRLSGTASVLATRLDSDIATSNGVSGNAGLSYAATSRILLRLDYDRSNQASVLVNTTYLRALSAATTT